VHRPSHLGSRFAGRTIAALVLMILTIALVVVVATLPWWEYVSSSGTHLYHYLGAWCYAPGSCVDYTDRGAPFRDVFPQTYVLVLTALALSVFELAFLVLAIFGNGGRLGILVTGILGSVALLVAPIYLYLGLSGSPFSGSSTLPNGVSSAWREGPGLFMAPFVAIFFLIATIVAFFVARHIKPLGNVPVSQS